MSVQALRAQFEKSKHEAISKSAHSIYNPVTQTFQSMPQPRHVQKEAFALSVKQLTLIFEQLSQQYGTLSGSSNWIEMVRNHVKKGDYYQRGIIDVQKVVADIAKDTGLIKTGKSARISDAVSVTIPDRFEKCKDEAKPELELAPAAQPDSMQLISTSTIESGPQGNGTLMEKILPKTITRPKKHACDMIGKEVTITKFVGLLQKRLMATESMKLI